MQHISTPWQAAKEQAHQCQLHPHGLIKSKLGYPCNKNQQQNYIHTMYRPCKITKYVCDAIVKQERI